MRAARRALYVMPDQMPSLRQLRDLVGCHFAPRCPLVIDDCRRAEPANVAVAPDHLVACIRAQATQVVAAPSGDLAPANASERPLLQVEDLRKHYDVGGGLFAGARTVAAVKQASFSIAANEFVALVGESGSGKSTIAKMLVGLEPPSGGRISLDGEDLTAPSARASALRSTRLQMVFQDPQSALNPRRRVASIVTQAMEAGSRHAEWDARWARTRELLAEVGLAADFGTRLPGQLSGGQRQRVNIARALCSLPKVLVADEIVSGLDVSLQAQLLNLLPRLHR
jgi:peptide/nickel transport system ATP-binding protein